MLKDIFIIVTELDLTDGCKHLQYIRYPLDDGKTPICYRSRVSHNAFFNSVKGRNRNGTSRLFTCRHEDEPSFHEDGAAEKVEVENIWSFYKLIGYDYKTKKFQEFTGL